MLYWHKFIKEEFSDEQVGFMDPARTCVYMLMKDREGVLEYIRKTLKENRDKRLIFIPYHQIDHWVLVVLIPRENALYVFDSDKKHKRMLMITLQSRMPFARKCILL